MGSMVLREACHAVEWTLNWLLWMVCAAGVPRVTCPCEPDGRDGYDAYGGFWRKSAIREGHMRSFWEKRADASDASWNQWKRGELKNWAAWGLRSVGRVPRRAGTAQLLDRPGKDG